MNESNPSIVQRYPVLSFFVLAFLFSYGFGIIAAVLLVIVLPESLQDHADVLAKFGPTFAGLYLAWKVSGSTGLRRLTASLFAFQVHIGWFAFALVLPFVVMGFSIVMYVLWGGEIYPERLNLTVFYTVLLLIPVKTFFGGGLGEELGWRGFALPQLQNHMSALQASLIIWVVWTVWHFPAFALDSDRTGEMPIYLFTIFVLSVTVLLTWVYNSTGGNLLIPVLFHASANASESLMEALVPVPNLLVVMQWFTLIYCVFAVLIVLLYNSESLSARSKVVWKD